jgi:hypothetical protein
MAFDAQNFTTRPPEAPVVSSTQAESELNIVAEAATAAVPPVASPVEAATENSTPDPAEAKSSSAPQGS